MAALSSSSPASAAHATAPREPLRIDLPERNGPRLTAEHRLDGGEEVALGPDARLSCHGLERLATTRATASYTEEAIVRMEASRQTLTAALERGDAVYGVTTGFGPHVRYAADADPSRQGAGLIAHLGAGCGPLAPREFVRAMIALRCRTLSMGFSGVDPAAAEALLSLINADVCPAVPMIGSVGASGDLVPLAHVARVVAGEGTAIDDAERAVDASEALADAGLAPLALSARDALAIVNGTAFMTAGAALAGARAERLLRRAEDLTGWAYRSLGARGQALDRRLHAARGHRGQMRSAERIESEAAGHGAFEDESRPLQEVYSIRCAPQVLGACRDQLEHAIRVIEREIEGVSDNPVVCGTPNDPAVLHGGNFQGQQIAFAADTLNSAMTQTANLIERQLDAILDPDTSGAPLLLAWQPGATSGMAGAQITATALAAEMRRNATPSAVASLPTNGRNQDIVSMGAMAARVAYEQAERLASVLAIHAIALGQLAFLRSRGRARGAQTETPEWMPAFEGFEADRPLHADIERIARDFLHNG